MASRALVLGAGGVTGVAWELGMLAGLAERGVDLTQADLVVGTSAGSLVGAQVTSGVSLRDLYAAQLAPPSGGFAAPQLGAWNLLRWAWAVAGSRDPVRVRARIGTLALAANTEPEAQRRKLIEARVPVPEWPPRRLAHHSGGYWIWRVRPVRCGQRGHAGGRGLRQLRGARSVPACHHQRQALDGRRGPIDRQRRSGRTVRDDRGTGPDQRRIRSDADAGRPGRRAEKARRRRGGVAGPAGAARDRPQNA